MNIIYYMKRLHLDVTLYHLPIVGSDEKLFFSFLIREDNMRPLIRMLSYNYEMFISKDKSWQNYNIMSASIKNNTIMCHKIVHSNDVICDVLNKIDIYQPSKK